MSGRLTAQERRDRARRSLDRAELHRLLDRLLDVRDLTDPAKNVDPSEMRLGSLHGKAELAGWSISVASNLAADISGWAINFIVGSIVDPQSCCDDHAHELAGAAYRYDGSAAASPLARKLLRELLKDTLGWYHLLPADHLVQVLITALAALEQGEDVELLKAVKMRRKQKRGLREALFQKRVIENVYFRAGQGKTLTEARHEVADICGCSFDTISGWEKLLLKEPILADECRRCFENARRAGELRVDPRFSERRKAAEIDPVTLHTLEELDQVEIKRVFEALRDFQREKPKRKIKDEPLPARRKLRRA